MTSIHAHSATPPLHPRWALRTTALALGSAMALLAGCGGGSGSTPDPVVTPTPTPTTPGVVTDFRVLNTINLKWSSVANATRYELFIDPDGAGPQAEALVAEGSGFSYGTYGNPTVIEGYLTLSELNRLNATYRLRACNNNGCGAFTSAQSFDIAASLSHSFSSGWSPLLRSNRYDTTTTQALSQDGLTLVLHTYNGGAPVTGNYYVFVRSTLSAPWQQQAVLDAIGLGLVLSADGNTLVTTSLPSSTNAVQVYYRSNGQWALQTSIATTQTPPACPQPCAVHAYSTALSADGNVLAITGRTGNTPNAVFTYHRSGSTWTPIGYLSPSANAGYSGVGSTMALSGDGRTLALNDSAFELRTDNLSPHMRIYTQAGPGVWTEQGSLPAGMVNRLDITAPLLSAARLSDDGNTLAIEGYIVPGHQPTAFDINKADLTCGSTVPWGTSNPPGGAYTAVDQHIALFARTGTTWSRKAVMARNGTQWALAPDGSSLYYGGEVFKNNAGTWTCP